MPEEQTNPPFALQPNQPSTYKGITIRAWLAIIVIGAVSLINVVLCVHAVTSGKTDFKVDGEFMMLASGILAHYFADKKPEPAKTP